jgi:hypothetical protein
MASSSKPDAKPPELPEIEVGRSSLEKPTTPGPLSDLIHALDRAESTPGYRFVALKWFRDVRLLDEGFPWAQSEAARRNVLREAIDKRMILTNRVENPKSPQFPVTAIRLNRLFPEVQRILGKAEAAGEDFNPMDIRGEGLSTTVLRDRG